MDKQREDFEKWFMPREERMRSQGVLNVSISIEKNRQWEIWQASRASIVVELPFNDIHSDETDELWDRAVESCAESLRSIGLSIKVE